MEPEQPHPTLLPEPATPPPSTQIIATLCPRISVAFHHNAIPLLRDLVVANSGNQPLRDLSLTLVSEPAFFRPRRWLLEHLAAGQRYHITQLDSELSLGLLEGLTETAAAELTFTLRQGETLLQEAAYSVELLPRNHWGGLGHLPELLAAFVQPNDPAVERVLKKAAMVLREHGKNPALDGYQQASKQRAWELISALWTAACGYGLDYALPPASFEQTGQKVRAPSHLLDNGLGTCLDLALLFAACLEQCHLHPVVVLTRGHALVGAWLVPEDFSNVITDDITALRKRIKLKELVVFETTLVTQRPAPWFSLACEQGERYLAEPAEDDFELAVDVRRARMQRILPLPSLDAEPLPAGELPELREPVFEAAPELDAPSHAPDARCNDPRSRLEHWQRKLLDLSLRNNLLNFRAGKRAVPLLVPEPERFEDALAQGVAFKLRAGPELMTGADPRSAALHLERHGEDVRQAYAQERFAQHEILIHLQPDELEARLVDLYRAARAALEEGGANILYAALGFLVWRREAKDERSYRAPLILIPVSLVRNSVRSGFMLKLHEDEPRFNPTLLEMLRQDFALMLPVAEGDLPKDDAGLDIRAIWHAVGNAIKEIAGWEVTEEVVLSTFSFAKHLMWRDLVERIDQLKQNPVVQHLIDTPRQPYRYALPFLPPTALDRELQPAENFCPLPADSSQLAAVLAAAQGRDFVLEGPPGTGKSQTIANLIAQCLAEGKTVLFVSEKMAALDVVYRRLRDVGLGEFCLELHSNKAHKLGVLSQLRQAWSAQGQFDTAHWAQEAERLQRLRDRINGYAEHLHRRAAHGISAFDAIGRVLAGARVPAVCLSWPTHDAHDHSALQTLRDIADRLTANALAVGAMQHHPLGQIVHQQWSPSWQEALVTAAQQLHQSAVALQGAEQRFTNCSGLPQSTLDHQQRVALLRLAEALPLAAGNDWRFVLRYDAPVLAQRLTDALALLQQRADRVRQLSVTYQPAVFKLDLHALRATWERSESSYWLKRVVLCRRVRKALQRVIPHRSKTAPSYALDLDHLLAIREADARLTAYADLVEPTQGLWNALATQPEQVLQALHFHRLITHGVATFATDPQRLTAAQAALQPLLGEANLLLQPGGAVATAAADYAQTLQRVQADLVQFETLSGASIADAPLPLIIEQATAIAEQPAKLKAWCTWRKARADALTAGLGALAAALETGSVAPAELREVFEVNYHRWWLNALVDADPVLREFAAVEHERAIENFKALDIRLMHLARQLIRARLCAALPDTAATAGHAEWGLLRREIEKKRRHVPLRQLIGGLPTALTRLTPCLLMSPLSVAQYLPAHATRFDLVVFDEASQITVWDAIGALARGQQAVIVGDPKQLPPTSFFERASNEEDAYIEEDLESILDECLGASLPRLTLSWHYRSRHESLIAFSNHRYYGGALVTFPAPVTDDRAVSFHYVENGVYEKGSARTNAPEAKALVTDLVVRLSDAQFAASGQTVGVVTFNAEQQRLIQDLLDEERRRNPALERFFTEDGVESVFVKNLENVQGDERDVMYFSITYGPDRAGHVSMNFGPMNRAGGERRLNVAVTRARHALRVFASVRPEQLDLSRTTAAGVRDLKHFLEYAERGPQALAEASFGSIGDFESPFEQAVALALRERGWTVWPQIGVSAFRVDLGVVDPDAPGRYLAGVECDGASYHSSATARDRDKLREEILRGLGWEIVRVWSTDWWIDAAGALETLDSRLRALLRASREQRAGAEAVPPRSRVG